jgi:putative cardiolipin synthase
MIRRLTFVLMFSVAFAMALACGNAPIATPTKQASEAFNQPGTTTLGKSAVAMAAGHDGNSGFLLMDRGRDALAWRAILADAAEKSIDAQYFLWKDDAAGKIMMQRLMAAADRGVRVRVLIDDSMTESDPQYLAAFGAYPNVEVRLYKPFGPKHDSKVLRWVDFVGDLKVLNHRMHNKMYIVDGSVAIIGGRNIGSEYFEYPVPFVFRSRDLLAFGPVLEHAGHIFDLYWNSDWAVPIDEVVAPLPTVEQAQEQKASLDLVAADQSSYPPGFYDQPSRLEEELADLEPKLHWGTGRLLVDVVPDRDGKPQTRAGLDRTGVVLGRTAAEATDEMHVQSAYLILLPDSMRLLGEMTARGVEVYLSTNSMASNNHLSAFVAYRKQRRQMLEHGARVYEMRPDAVEERALFTTQQLEENDMYFGLHAKTMVFDRRITFVGSFNLDPRSVDLNSEMGLLVESEGLANAVADSIENDIAAGNSWQVILDEDGNQEWITTENGAVIFRSSEEPMTTEAQRAEADALEVVPDKSQM